MKCVINYKRLKLSAFVMFVALCFSTTHAQSASDQNYVARLKIELDSLKKCADDYYIMHVQPIEEELGKIGDEDPQDAENRKEHQNLLNEQNSNEKTITDYTRQIGEKKAEKSRMENNLDGEVLHFVAKLLNSRCNTDAIQSLEECEHQLSQAPKNNRIRRDISKLYKYESYCEEMRAVLEDVKYEIEVGSSQWKNVDKAIMNMFNERWNSVSYRDCYGNPDKRIQFLDKVCDEVENMKRKGFQNCKAQFEAVLEKLTPTNKYDTDLTSPIKQLSNIEYKIKEFEKKKRDEENAKSERESRILELEGKINKNNKNNEKFNRLVKQRNEQTEKWYDRREALDQKLTEACRYCLSQPCDSLGNNIWLRKEIKDLTDTTKENWYPQFSSYKKSMAEFHVLFSNYEEYTYEIKAFLKKMYKYCSADGRQLSQEYKKDIDDGLKSLSYWKYYSKKDSVKKEKAVHSPFLDGVLNEFKEMYDSNFKGCVDRYGKLHKKVPKKPVRSIRTKITP